MKEDAAFVLPKRRDDMLVSVGFTLVHPTESSLDFVRYLQGILDAAFRYWEILVIADAEEAVGLAPLFDVVSNLRLIKVRQGTTAYRRRFIIAQHAIGDVVAITSGNEAAGLDLVAMIESSINEASLVISRRRSTSIFDPVIKALGKASGFEVSTRDTQTSVYPRKLLDMLAARHDKDLALRFAPRDPSINIIEVLRVKGHIIERRGLRGTRQRMSLVQKLFVNLASRILGYLTIFAALVAFAALVFTAYVFGVWFFVDSIQPGWITTSLLLTGTGAFLGLSVFCLASGLQLIIDLLSPDTGRDVIDEKSTVDLFSDVMTELNVDEDASDAQMGQIAETGSNDVVTGRTVYEK